MSMQRPLRYSEDGCEWRRSGDARPCSRPTTICRRRLHCRRSRLVVLLLATSASAFQPLRPFSARLSPTVSRLQSTPTATNGEQAPSDSRTIPLLDSATQIDESLALYEGDPNDYRYSADDWWHNILTLRRSTILRATKSPIVAVTVWSFIVSAVYALTLQLCGPAMANHMTISSQPHSFLVSALSLLLVFRTNSAYQRFAEGRCIWERILAVSRNLTRMAILYSREFGDDRLRRMFRLLAAFPYLLHHHIQPQSDLSVADTPYGMAIRAHTAPSRRFSRHARPRLSKNNVCWVDVRTLPWTLFPPAVMKTCARSSNRPLWVCDRLAMEVNEIPYTPNFTSRERLTLLSHIDKLSTSIGECERIHQTAVPLNYARHSLRALTLWLFTLPFGLVKDLGWWTSPIMLFVSWALTGIYELAHQTETPFQGSLRMSILCDAIYRDVMYGTIFMKLRMTAFTEGSEDRKSWREMDETAPSPRHVKDLPRP